MKKYLLFAGDKYYPSGGWRDFKGAYDSYDEAMAVASSSCMSQRYQTSKEHPMRFNNVKGGSGVKLINGKTVDDGRDDY